MGRETVDAGAADRSRKGGSLVAELSRLSLNQITTPSWNVGETAEACVRHGVPGISLWRHKISEFGLKQSVQAVRDAGLHVSSVCRGGMFPAPDATERRAKIEDNLRAIDEAAALNADVLVFVVGGAAPVGIAAAREMVRDGFAALVPYAEQAGVKLGLEPLHPMFAGDRSVLTTIDEALEVAAQYAEDRVGVVLDVFHIWWHPNVLQQIAEASGRIMGFHVSDWPVPLPDTLLGRCMMGDGIIDLRTLRTAVDAAGYDGPIEVEIFNQAIWDEDPDAVLTRTKQRFLESV
ncbi:MAG: sugar phosphate isomerase/epimerase [Acidobacteria bacterium]|nr:sugar phosphate isomerase/epimerase [Acidobacteriota bacterium]